MVFGDNSVNAGLLWGVAMPKTAKNHFDEDISRSQSLRQHAESVETNMLKGDILRAAVMMAVGACDAYFCDAYADLVSRALRAKDLQRNVVIPNGLANLKVPAIAVIRNASGGWRWRMVARELMEDASVLSLGRIRELFNHFFRKGYKVLNSDTIEPWILHADAKTRCMGISPSQYRASVNKSKTRKNAIQKLEQRFACIFQRRHDCIHNCDRPKIALQRISGSEAKKIIEDVVFLVSRMDESLREEFPLYLKERGFSAIVRNRVLTGID
jgi:hypothetical protein